MIGNSLTKFHVEYCVGYDIHSETYLFRKQEAPCHPVNSLEKHFGSY